MPLLICIFIALMDRFGSCELTLPNMGVSQCFLGSPWGDQWVASYSNGTNGMQWNSFFYSPEFIYFHSILIGLQAANVFFFLLTVCYLVDHWRNAAGMIKSETKRNFLIVVKLVFIMGRLLHILYPVCTFIAGRHSLVWRVHLSSSDSQEWYRKVLWIQICNGFAESLYCKQNVVFSNAISDIREC